jgi:lipopolysaccharide export system protein LptC
LTSFTSYSPLLGQAYGGRSAVMANWRKRSALIHGMRKALPAMAAAIVIGLLGWVVGKTLISTIINVRSSAPTTIRMMNARFFGQSSEGRAYMLAAKEASRDAKDIKRVSLVAPVLTLDLHTANPTTAKADRGLFLEGDKILHLNGNVVFTSAQGYIFNTDTAVVDTMTGIVTGNNLISGTGPFGDIQAKKYGIYDKGTRIVFEGNVHGRIKGK